MFMTFCDCMTFPNVHNCHKAEKYIQILDTNLQFIYEVDVRCPGCLIVF